MKRPKDRLHRVIVIGATPAGVAATNKLGELGIPVTLIDPEPDLNQKLSRRKWRFPSGIAFNFAHRSGLLRMIRNQAVKCLLPADVTSLKHTPQGFRARVRTSPTFVRSDNCVLCGRCDETCPVTTADGTRPIQFEDRASLPGRPFLVKGKQPPCQAHCPLGVNAQGYIALARAGRYEQALDLIRQNNILPGICGRICTHPCEAACRRGELDDPIAVRHIKRFLADYELHHPSNELPPAAAERPEKIAVIGSGPAGLAAAADLRRLGYVVTVFEKEDAAGGLLRYGIGPHRLPRDILDHELEAIEKLGVRFALSHPVDLTRGGLNDLKKEYNAVLVTIGAWSDRRLGVPGEELEGVEGCLSFLRRLHHFPVDKTPERVAVIGDGNSAFDLARGLRRRGAEVTLLSWFPRELIPADNEEIEGAREEGVALVDQTQVVSFSGRNGKLASLICRATKPGEPDEQGIPWPVIVEGSEPVTRPFDRAIVAIGQKGSLGEGNAPAGLDVTARGLIETDESFQTNLPFVFAAGDGATGPSSVVEAMAAGRSAAAALHRAMGGETGEAAAPYRPTDRDFVDIPADIPSLSRPTMPERQPAARWDNFSEVALGLSESQVLSETERCLNCGICSECLLCEEACSTIGAINHAERPEEIVEHAGVVIIADPQAAPLVKGEDVVRAYGPKAANSAVVAMMPRGFAAAARAMVLLGGASLRPKGRGVSFSPPGPELASHVRVGVFVCRCNDSFGWHEEMDAYVSRLTDQKDVVHAEVTPSACVPQGAAAILRTIREKGITRVVLASCVCCPLDFVCSACTDQRSRLKDALFTGTGVSRSMVETCNLRGEVLRHLPTDPSTAMIRFAGLIYRSIQRAKRLKALPVPERPYNFTTAIIGDSEAALTSARTLAEAGLEVFMFGSTKEPPVERPGHPNILFFEDATVKGVSGTLGDFQIYAESETLSQVLQVGAVIIGEKYGRLVPYIPQKGLPGTRLNSSTQKKGVPGIPFLYPGATSIAGLFWANPTGIHVSERKKGAAAAVLAAAIMPRGPRQSKGYTALVDKDRCRGCGRCHRACPYQAITFYPNDVNGWYAVVDEALCKGCGNCISVCPSNAADSPYRDQAYLEQMLEEVLIR